MKRHHQNNNAITGAFEQFLKHVKLRQAGAAGEKAI